MTVRRYFDRNPGATSSVGEVTRIINNYYESTGGVEVDELGRTVSDLLNVVQDMARFTPQTQVVSAAVGDVVVNLADGNHVHVVETAGPWTVRFSNVPAAGITVIVSVDVTNDGDELVIPDVSWYGTSPVTADWDAGETNVIRLTKVPFVSEWIAEWILNTSTPEQQPVIVPPTLTASYSTNANRSGALPLESATLPAGQVAVFFGPQSSDISSMRFFYNHTGTLPAVGLESGSYVGADGAVPWDLLGGTSTTAVLWDTRFDPSGNNGEDHDPNGTNTITVEATLIDGQTVVETFTFDLSNVPIGADPDVVFSATAYGSGVSTHSVSVPTGVDRLVLVQAVYGGPFELTSMMIGGNAMTKLVNACQPALTNQELGVFVAYATEASLSTGSMTVTPTYTSTPPARGRITYKVWTVTNVASPSLAGHVDYKNVSDVSTPSLQTTLASVAANSMLFGTGAQKITTSAEMTSTLGTLSASLEQSSFESRSFTIVDSGSSGTKTADWVGNGRSLASMVALEYATSSGGEEVTPIIPAVPTISSVTVSDNQGTVTWGSATNAVSYEIRWGQGASPTVPNGAPVAAVSPRTITGLIASQSYGVQVRSVSSTNNRSAWSAVSYFTPTGFVEPPPEFSGKFLVSTDHRDVAMSEGRAALRFTDLWVPTVWVRRNVASSESALANVASNTTQLDEVINNYENRTAGNATPFIAQAGPRLIWTMKMSIIGATLGRNTNHSKGTGEDAALGQLDVAKSGSKGAINRNATWDKIAADLMKTYRGYKVHDIVWLSLAHETNGPWTSMYMGTNPKLVGQPTLLNAKASDYGSAMAAALVKAGTTGACDDIHRLACEHVFERILDKTNGKAILGMSPADGAASTTEPTTLGSSWVESAFPNVPVDFITPTIYCNGKDNVRYKGSGDVNDYRNYERPRGWMEHTYEYVNQRYGAAGGLLEHGGMHAVPGSSTPGQLQTATDLQIRAFQEKILEDVLRNEYKQGLAFVNHWFSLSWQGADNSGSGMSWSVLEGQWGFYPSGVGVEPNVPSTRRPSWSTADGSFYLREMDFFRSRFPR